MNRPEDISPYQFANSEWLRKALYCIFALCILAISIAFFSLSIGRPYMGTMLSLVDGVWIVSLEDVNGATSKAGVKDGDVPLEINGLPAEVFLERYEDAGEVFGRLINELTVINNRGQLLTVTLKNASISWQSMIGQITWLFVCLTFWIVGFYAFFKRPKNASTLLLSLFGLALGLALSANMAVEIEIPSSLWFEIMASTICPWLLLHFFLVLPQERSRLRDRPFIYLIYLPAIIILILFPFAGYANDQPLPWFRTIRMLVYAIGFLSVFSVVIFNYLRSASSITRQQMKIVLIGCFLALVPFLILDILPELILGRSIIPPAFIILFTIFIPISMGYAVVTTKLLNIDVIIRRGIIYGLITLVMTGVLSVAIFFVLTFEESLDMPEEILIALAAGAIATFLFGPLRKGSEYLIDKYFYKDRYDYRQIIQSLGISLNSARDLNSVSRLVVGTTVHTLNLMGGCLFVRIRPNHFQVNASQGTYNNKAIQNELQSLISRPNHEIKFPYPAWKIYPNLAFFIPLVAADKEVGFLCVSPKITRQDFSPDDIFLLQGIAAVAAIALHSTLLLHDVNIRDAFVSVASHELRTPLTSIIGYADLLLHRNPPDEKRKQWITKIFDNGQKLCTIVDDLLNISRIQSGKINLTLEKVRLSEIFQEALSLARESANKHEFIVDLEPNLPTILIDRDKLTQVVGNLLSNAVKYSPNGGRITLSAYNEPGKNQVIISIADEGVGISSADRDSLFTMFHRIKRPETQGIKGSGLGLYIVKELTEAMGGRSWVESEVNKGSTFFIAIPIQISILIDEKSITSVS